jgi:hypothetical protein
MVLEILKKQRLLLLRIYVGPFSSTSINVPETALLKAHIWLTSKTLAFSRVHIEESDMPVPLYSRGISYPPKSTRVPPYLTCKSYNGVLLRDFFNPGELD